MQDPNKMNELFSELKQLSLQDKATMKKVLDKLLIDERRTLVYLDYPASLEGMLAMTPAYAAETPLLEEELIAREN
jgi:hypothetical protein